MKVEGPTLTIIIPSISAPTLVNTCASIYNQELYLSDQILVVGDGPQEFAKSLVEKVGPPFYYLEYGPEHNWGNPQRNYALRFARGDYLVWMDEDDIFMPGIFRTIRQVGSESPGRPMIFRFILPDRRVLWQQRGQIERGGIGGHQLVAPNVPRMVGRWGSTYEGDFDFIRSTLNCYPSDDVCLWREEIIAACRPHLT